MKTFTSAAIPTTSSNVATLPNGVNKYLLTLNNTGNNTNLYIVNYTGGYKYLNSVTQIIAFSFRAKGIPFNIKTNYLAPINVSTNYLVVW